MTDADQYVQLPGDGTGKKIRVFELVVPTQDASTLAYIMQTMEQQTVTLLQADGRELQLDKVEGLLEKILDKLDDIHSAMRGF